jgi:hypothetical protein
MLGARVSEPTSRPHSDVPSQDRFLLWPAIVAIVVPGLLVILSASPLGMNFAYVMLGIPALLLGWAIAAGIAGIGAFGAAKRQAWRRAGSSALLPAVVLAAALQLMPFVRSCAFVGDLLNFEIMRPRYLAEAAQIPADGPRLMVFDRGGMVWASKGVVYDESDEVARPQGAQSAEWRSRASHTELACGGYSVRPLGGHFYLADFPC